MNDDSNADAQDVSDKQKAWNAQYYDFLNVYQRGLLKRARIFTEWCDEIAECIRSGQTPDALLSLTLLKEKLADYFKLEPEMVQKHHEYVDRAMGCYEAMTKVLRDYSLDNNDQDIANKTEMQLSGIQDFTLAAIAYLDTER